LDFSRLSLVKVQSWQIDFPFIQVNPPGQRIGQ